MSSVTNSLVPQGPQAEISPRRQKSQGSKEEGEAFLNSSRRVLKASSKASASVSTAVFGALFKGAVVASVKEPITGVLLNLGVDQVTNTTRQYAEKGVDCLVDSKATTVVLTKIKQAYDSTVWLCQYLWTKK